MQIASDTVQSLIIDSFVLLSVSLNTDTPVAVPYTVPSA